MTNTFPEIRALLNELRQGGRRSRRRGAVGLVRPLRALLRDELLALAPQLLLDVVQPLRHVHLISKD